MTAPQYHFRERLHRFLLLEYWNIGVVHQPIVDIARRGIVVPVQWLNRPAFGTMLADPSVMLCADGTRTLFAEYLDYRIGRGEIWAARLAAGEDPARARFQPLIATGFHMSYPQVVQHGGQTYLICESWQSRGIPLWRWTDGAWAPLPPLLAGHTVVDPTLFPWDGRWWLFCTFEDDQPNGRLHLFHAPDPLGPWTPHPDNPVSDDPASARPAGPLFPLDGTPIRPAQDCSATYGGAVVLNEIVRLTVSEFRERPLRRLEPVGAPYRSGLHTICAAGDWTLIDGKRWGRDPLPLISQVSKKSRDLVNRLSLRMAASANLGKS